MQFSHNSSILLHDVKSGAEILDTLSKYFLQIFMELFEHKLGITASSLNFLTLT